MIVHATDMLCQLFKINLYKISTKEKIIFEAEIFTSIYDELKIIIKLQNKEYFRLIKLNNNMEDAMIEGDFIRCIINDILFTGEYSLTGIAYYTQTPEDVIHEIVIGRNNSPSITLSRKIIGLHRSVRPSLYDDIIKKITENFFNPPLSKERI